MSIDIVTNVKVVYWEGEDEVLRRLSIVDGVVYIPVWYL